MIVVDPELFGDRANCTNNSIMGYEEIAMRDNAQREFIDIAAYELTYTYTTYTWFIWGSNG